MNKKAIWAIIGLMSAAVIGIVWLQMDLIRTSIRVNEEKFDNNVINALNNVALRIENEEKRENIGRYNYNGYVDRFYRAEAYNQRNAKSAVPLNMTPKSPVLTPSTDLKRNQLLDDLIVGEIYRETYRRLYYNQGSYDLPISERIDKNHLKETLEQELKNWQIDIEYRYGVYSKVRKSFVILNDIYAVEDVQGDDVLPGFKNLFNSKYRVDLFRDVTPAPGLLMIHFPSKTSYVWRSVIANFLGSILFTGVILFCFGYTISVIFRQKKVSEMKTDFINNMTHEFKTPIATISLAADSITSPMIASNESKVKRFADIIKQENKRMNNQVEKVLQMALIDKRDFSLKVTQVNLHDVIARAVENISLQVEKKNGVASAVFDATNPIVEGDLTHISNIINNLLDNANKYSPEEPEITVSTRDLAKGVEVTVQDKGIGMSKEAKKHIFDKFYRVHTGNLHDVKGFGLGLSYVKAMMVAHKGEINVKSDLGKGSSFILFFPFQVNSN